MAGEGQIGISQHVGQSFFHRTFLVQYLSPSNLLAQELHDHSYGLDEDYKQTACHTI
jgi:hypothetical protein